MATIKDLKRMCESMMCKDCPFVVLGCCEPNHFLDNADEIVDKWAAEHPIKTYAMDFFSKFPNAPRDSNGTPEACMQLIYGDGISCDATACASCWNSEMKEDE